MIGGYDVEQRNELTNLGGHGMSLSLGILTVNRMASQRHPPLINSGRVPSG